MPTLTPELPNCPAPRPHHRLVIPDPLEPWTLDDVDFLLWPNSPEHLPGALQELEEGGPDGVAMGGGGSGRRHVSGGVEDERAGDMHP